jgi:hypothetical protein
VFAGGSPKFASYGASVGVHGASDQTGQETVEAGAATVSMARIVKNLGVPAPIIGKMVVTPAEQIVWLTPDDLRSMGATMTGKPAQVPTDQSGTSQPLRPAGFGFRTGTVVSRCSLKFRQPQMQNHQRSGKT